MAVITLASGLVTSVMDLEHTPGLAALNTKVNTSMIRDMVTENLITMLHTLRTTLQNEARCIHYLIARQENTQVPSVLILL